MIPVDRLFPDGYADTIRKGQGGFPMTIAKQQVLDLLKDLPEQVDIDEVIYRLYLRQKIELAEQDVREGRLVSHAEVVKESSQWFKK
jgi:hypothetical protein